MAPLLMVVSWRSAFAAAIFPSHQLSLIPPSPLLHPAGSRPPSRWSPRHPSSTRHKDDDAFPLHAKTWLPFRYRRKCDTDKQTDGEPEPPPLPEDLEEAAAYEYGATLMLLNETEGVEAPALSAKPIRRPFWRRLFKRLAPSKGLRQRGGARLLRERLRRMWPESLFLRAVLRGFRDHMKAASGARGINWEESDYFKWIDWSERVRNATDGRTVIPAYFEAPIHGILGGNLCITQAVEQSAAMSATMMLFQGVRCFRKEALNRLQDDIESAGPPSTHVPSIDEWQQEGAAVHVDHLLPAVPVLVDQAGQEDVNATADMVPVSRIKRILDVGCGTGDSTALLQARYPNAEVEGVDLSPHMIAVARYRYPNMVFHHEAGEKTFFENDTFDMVTMFAVAHELPKGVTFRILKEAHRILRKGGCFLFVDQDPESPTIRRQLAVPEITGYIEPYLADFCSINLPKYFRRAGYKVITTNREGVFVAVLARKLDEGELSDDDELEEDTLVVGDDPILEQTAEEDKADVLTPC
ncbi:unnamed protein product [Vitrella brassicaformis CCMP3155]|uniref:Methyltransferase domain-containing protein n=2 Tax=Vitrella brassicaformis TaxID=1169539 RepID=A0A0G4EV10_VITBC|nr:unnamed protein product [Vitrella brassicaformis CCMP3155]|eukprot:CEM01877.1 unnamed protein product [Vitrella brassicaformis CCMP3155]